MNAVENLISIIDAYEIELVQNNYLGAFRDAADRIAREYIELPKDADGGHIRIGDRVFCQQKYKSPDGDNVIQSTGKVEEIVCSSRGWTVYVDSYDDSFPADCVQHVISDSMAQILHDIGEYPADQQKVICKFVNRARALGGEK